MWLRSSLRECEEAFICFGRSKSLGDDSVEDLIGKELFLFGILAGLVGGAERGPA